jgi:hypothetical protein
VMARRLLVIAHDRQKGPARLDHIPKEELVLGWKRVLEPRAQHGDGWLARIERASMRSSVDTEGSARPDHEPLPSEVRRKLSREPLGVLGGLPGADDGNPRPGRQRTLYAQVVRLDLEQATGIGRVADVDGEAHPLLSTTDAASCVQSNRS